MRSTKLVFIFIKTDL